MGFVKIGSTRNDRASAGSGLPLRAVPENGFPGICREEGGGLRVTTEVGHLTLWGMDGSPASVQLESSASAATTPPLRSVPLLEKEGNRKTSPSIRI
jgi:hypothetical protein